MRAITLEQSPVKEGAGHPDEQPIAEADGLRLQGVGEERSAFDGLERPAAPDTERAGHVVERKQVRFVLGDPGFGDDPPAPQHGRLDLVRPDTDRVIRDIPRLSDLRSPLRIVAAVGCVREDSLDWPIDDYGRLNSDDVLLPLRRDRAARRSERPRRCGNAVSD